MSKYGPHARGARAAQPFPDRNQNQSERGSRKTHGSLSQPAVVPHRCPAHNLHTCAVKLELSDHLNSEPLWAGLVCAGHDSMGVMVSVNSKSLVPIRSMG